MNPIGIAALLGVLAITTDTGRLVLRKIVRTSVLAGYTVKESISDMTQNVNASCTSLMAEIKSDVAEAKAEATAGVRGKKPHKATKHDVDTSENYV